MAGWKPFDNGARSRIWKRTLVAAGVIVAAVQTAASGSCRLSPAPLPCRNQFTTTTVVVAAARAYHLAELLMKGGRVQSN